jgi:hypothetical protein
MASSRVSPSGFRTIGTLADYALGRVVRVLRPDHITRVHADLKQLAAPVTDQVQRLRATSGEAIVGARRGDHSPTVAPETARACGHGISMRKWRPCPG